MQILAYVSSVMEVESSVDHASFTLEDVESNIVRCPDQEAAQKMIDGETAAAAAAADLTAAGLPAQRQQQRQRQQQEQQQQSTGATWQQQQDGGLAHSKL